MDLRRFVSLQMDGLLPAPIEHHYTAKERLDEVKDALDLEVHYVKKNSYSYSLLISLFVDGT